MSVGKVPQSVVSVRPSVTIDRKQVANVGSVMLTADEEAERKLLHVCDSYVYLAGD